MTAPPPRSRSSSSTSDRSTRSSSPGASGRRASTARSTPTTSRSTPPRRRPRALVLSGGPASVYGEGRRASGAEIFALGVPVLGICYGLQLTPFLLGGGGAVGRGRRVRAGQGPGGSRGRSLRAARGRRRDRGVDEPRRPAGGAAGGLQAIGADPGIAALRRRRRGAPHLRPPVPPRGGPHAARARDPRRLPLRRGRARGHLDAGLVRRGGRRRGAREGRARPTAPSSASRAASTRPWRRCSASGRWASGSPASSSTTACCACARPRAWCARSATTSRSASCTSTRARASWSELAGVTDPEKKRKIIGRVFIEVFEEEAKKVDERALAGAGHALPGRHRERVVQGPERGHQEPPQRGRPARADARSTWSSRCASCSRTRCAPPATALGMPPRGALPPPVPRPGPRRALPRRDHARRGSPCCARPTRSSTRRSAPAASTSACGRASPCSCRCGPWA